MDSPRHASSVSTTSPTSHTNAGLSAIVAAAAAKQLHQHRNEKDSSTTTCNNTTTHQPLLEARKKRIVELSMAELNRRLDIWLESDELKGPALAAAGARGVKRRRGGDDAGGVLPAGAVGVVGSLAEKKRARRAPTDGGRLWACPFARHDPAGYAGVKTCCGPGWVDVHRVKEHIYRKHWLKNACNRCFETFDDAKGLKDHQRARTPCRLSDDARTDIVTDEQVELLKARARANAPQQEKWEDMYRIVFPDEKTIPSPFYTTPVPTPVVATAATAAPAGGKKSAPPSLPSRFSDIDECKAYVKREILRTVKPMLEAEVERALATVEVKVVQKANEIVRDVQCKLARTWHWQAQAEPTPEPEPTAGPDFSGVNADFGEVLESFEGDPMFAYLVPEGEFPWESYIPAGSVAEGGCAEGDCVGSVGRDSAYYTGGLDGVGSESWETTGSGRV